LEPIDAVKETTVNAIARRWWPLLVPFAALATLVLFLLLRRSGSRRPIDPRLAELQRRNDDLVRFALSLGVSVTPATTLSDLASELQRRTGVDLAHHLDAHLAARYGNGPMPEPWPIDRLRQAARTKPAAANA
jgi:hypothetical protein